MIRDDLSTKLIHLTRGRTGGEIAEKFLSILSQEKLIGADGEGQILGNYKCICFSEAPVSKFALVLSHANQQENRYAPFGVIVDKKWLFQKGGRPVIYQTEEEYLALPEPMRFRHVSFDPERDVDCTWEREWRIRADILPLEAERTTLILPTRAWAEYLKEQYRIKVPGRRAAAGAPPAAVMKWHFLVLEDLGVGIETPVPPPSA